MKTPDPINSIAADVLAGRPRRAKVRTLLGYYGLKRRREAGLGVIREQLTELGISTVPDFESAGFDDQVRFVELGQESAAAPIEQVGEANTSFSIEAQPSTGSEVRYRVLLNTFDAYERFLHRLVSERLAKVFQHGQNPRRQDRDAFPFFATVEIAAVNAPALESWLDDAVKLGAESAESIALVEHPTELSVAQAHDGLFEQIADLHEAMRAELGRHTADLRQVIEQKVDEVRLEALRKLAKELNDDEALKVIQEFEQETRQRLEDKDAELKEAMSHVSLLSAQVADLEEQLAEQDTYNPGDAYPTMSATVQLFSEISAGDPVLVLDSAMKSAARSASPKRREVLKLLLCLREYAMAVYGTTPLNVRPDDWFGPRGFDYAQGDSESTRNKHGHERIFDVDGASVQFEEHVTLFPNSPNCVSVYWLRDDVKRRLVIGYVGPHLRTVSR